MATVVENARRISLGNIKSSRCVQPYRTLIYGAEKVGKTGFVCKAPGVIALDVENRMGHYDVPKFPQITTWAEALDAMEVLRVGKHDYQNVVVDSVSYLEKLLKQQVMEDGNWTAIEADEFQRWLKVAASSYWPKFFAACERLERERGMGVLFTAHMQIKSMKNPNGEPYDRYRPALVGELGPQLFLHWCHDVLLASFDDIVRVEKKGGRDRVRTGTTGKRLLHTRHTPSWDAGNSCGLPPTMVFEWGEYARSRSEGLASLPDLQKQLDVLIGQIKDPDTRSKAKVYCDSNRGDVGVCRQAIGRCREIIEAQDQPEEEEQKS